jgi:hypothetical protein
MSTRTRGPSPDVSARKRRHRVGSLEIVHSRDAFREKRRRRPPRLGQCPLGTRLCQERGEEPDRVLTHDSGRGTFRVALDTAAWRIWRALVDAGQSERGTIHPERMEIFAVEQHGARARDAIERLTIRCLGPLVSRPTATDQRRIVRAIEHRRGDGRESGLA